MKEKYKYEGPGEDSYRNREMIDALREILGLRGLYKYGYQHDIQKYVTPTMASTMGSGCRMRSTRAAAL